MPLIEDYALLGDTHSAALVSREGSIDWLCLPRFDSPSCFAALLDGERGGYWRIRPVGPSSSERTYVEDTMLLSTTFRTDGGSARVTDFLALEKGSTPGDPRGVRPEEVVVRIVEGLEGSVEMVGEFRPRFDYGSVHPWFRRKGRAIEAVGGPFALDLVAECDLEMDDDRVRSRFTVSEGKGVSFLASYHPSHIEMSARDPRDCRALLDRTRSFWEQWASQCPYRGRWRDRVMRSLLTLKALTYSPSGGLVAAPTTSLPEHIGGARNWDYRYCWLRDATFTLDTLLDLGYTLEAGEWRDWLLRSVAGDPDEMQIMYGVLGERRLDEYVLDLAGYENSKPVRIGNAAVEQFQLDVYGEVMDSFHSARRAGIDTPAHAWELEKVIASFVCDHWQEPDEGIWEVRSGRRHFVHSKVMAWVAVDRAIKAVEEFGKEGPVDVWSKTRDAITQDVMSRGVHPGLRRFKRAYDDDSLDGSLLMLPLVGFVDAKDEIMVNTIEAIHAELMSDGFIRRYDTTVVDDGLPPGEGVFLMCTFWLVDCLALLGRMEEAGELFERLCAVQNDIGLFSEQWDPHRGRQLGNFPQAFSHVALITSAMVLETAGETRAVHRGE